MTEVAVVELLSTFPYGVEADWDGVIDRVRDLQENKKVRLDRIGDVVAMERRKPQLREKFTRLVTDLDR
jgi:hypothetical protein